MGKPCDTPVAAHGAGRSCLVVLGPRGPGPGPPRGGGRRAFRLGSGGAGAPWLRLNLERSR